MATTLGRNVRIDDTLWKTAMHRAEQRGETVTDVIRAALEIYVGIPSEPVPNAAAKAAERKLAKIRQLVDC